MATNASSGFGSTPCSTEALPILRPRQWSRLAIYRPATNNWLSPCVSAAAMPTLNVAAAVVVAVR